MTSDGWAAVVLVLACVASARVMYLVTGWMRSRGRNDRRDGPP